MNLLAHALLSPPDDGILVGNMTADWIKGRARRALPPDIQRGFELHRRIDAFADTHPLVARCCECLASRWERYAPVLVDILFDHALACRWADHTAAPLEAFIARTYTVLRHHMHLLPPRAQFAIHALLADDWLNCYRTLDGIALSLTRLSNRLRHDVQLAPAVRDFHRHRAAFDESFAEFFPLLRRHVAAAPASPVHCPA